MRAAASKWVELCTIIKTFDLFEKNFPLKDVTGLLLHIEYIPKHLASFLQLLGFYKARPI